MIDSFWLAVASGCTVLAVSGIFVILWWFIRQKIADMSRGMDGLTAAITKLQNDFGMQIATVQREMAKDQKESEARFTAALKESDNRFYAYSARVSEVAEGQLKMELRIHTEFMRTETFKETFSDFRTEIKSAVEKVEHQLEKGLDKLDKSLQTRA
jgi:hypothetical protein